MWIVYGGNSKTNPAEFVSVVQAPGNPDVLVVRARDRKSLQSMVKTIRQGNSLTSVRRIDIVDNEGTDYPFRVYITRDELIHYLTTRAQRLDYTNVKARVTETRGQVWHDALMRVWVALRVLMPFKGKVREYDYPMSWVGEAGSSELVGKKRRKSK